jgi:flagellar basal body-associated protein FliL
MDRILYIIVFFLLGIIALGTIVAFATHKAQPGVLLRRAEPAPVVTDNPKTQNTQSNKTIAYTGLGQIRAPVKPAPSANAGETQIVLISPWFSYPRGDSPFYEELSAKNRKLKLIFSDYFSRYTMKELLAKGEADVKNDITALMNDELILGKLSDLYFDEYIFLD